MVYAAPTAFAVSQPTNVPTQVTQQIDQNQACATIRTTCLQTASNFANIPAQGVNAEQSIIQANNCGVHDVCFNSASNTANIQAPATVSQSIAQANNCGVHDVCINGASNTQAPVTRLQSITR